jgi:iron complex transport system ATP-binding protein
MATDTQSLMTVTSLDFAYGQREVLRKVNLEIKAGELRGLFGPNGSGKTTLFKCCLGFLKSPPSAIKLKGKALPSYNLRDLAREVAYVPQEHGGTFPFTVREMVEMGRTPHAGAISVLTVRDKRVVDSALERVGLSHLQREDYNHLSGGQRQLVLVARALAQETTLMFLDEPTSSLDFSNQLRIWEMIKSIAREGLGVVICSHDPNHILWYCDAATALKDGEVLADGPAKEIISCGLLKTLYHRDINIASIDGRYIVYPLS